MSEATSTNHLKKEKSIKGYASAVFKESSSPVSGILTTSSIPRKVFRVIIFLIFTIGFLYQCIEFLKYLLDYPTVVNIEIGKPETYIGPAYTFCNNQKILRSKYCKKYPDRCTSTDEEFCKNNFRYCQEAETRVRDEYLMEIVGYEELLQLGHEIEDLLFDVRPHHLSSEYESVIRIRGVEDLNDISACFTFNSRVNSPYEPPLVHSDSSFMSSYVSEYAFAFKSGEDDIFDPDIPPGILFAVHSPFDAVNPFFHGIFLKPGRQYKISVSLKEEKLLPYPYKTDCENYHENWIKRGKSGPRSQVMCREKCAVDYISACFNCSLIFLVYPSDKNNLCSELDKKCDLMLEEMFSCINACKEECLKLSYYPEVRELYLSRRPPNSSYFKDPRQIYVDVDVDNTEFMSFVYRPQYQNVEAFSYIGGFIGVWLGISLVQVSDFLESVFLIARYFCKRRIRTPPQTV